MASDTPSGPNGLPLVENVVDLVREQGDFYENAAAEYGDIAPNHASGRRRDVPAQ